MRGGAGRPRFRPVVYGPGRHRNAGRENHGIEVSRSGRSSTTNTSVSNTTAKTTAIAVSRARAARPVLVVAHLFVEPQRRAVAAGLPTLVEHPERVIPPGGRQTRRPEPAAPTPFVRGAPLTSLRGRRRRRRVRRGGRPVHAVDGVVVLSREGRLYAPLSVPVQVPSGLPGGDRWSVLGSCTIFPVLKQRLTTRR